jgi:histidine triad (HIT) family protein
MADCLFCKIAAGEIPADIVHADDEFVAFRDIAPRAPVHVLDPRRHIRRRPTSARRRRLAGRLLVAAARITRSWPRRRRVPLGAELRRRRGQTVPHLHLHKGGRELGWPQADGAADRARAHFTLYWPARADQDVLVDSVRRSTLAKLPLLLGPACPGVAARMS